MSEYLKTETEDGTPFLIEVESVQSEPVKYFWMISADFTKRLDEPVREYHEHGYTIKTHESGMGFMGDIYTPKPDETVTRMGLLCFAIRQVLNSQNESRRAAGETLMFDASNVIVKAFDCGRNEL